METQLETPISAAYGYGSSRARAIGVLGPLAVFAGVLWAIVQPWRMSLLHPHRQGFWWLAVEPPLLVAGAGILFALAIARPLLADMEEHDGAAR